MTSKYASGMAIEHCLVEIEKWDKAELDGYEEKPLDKNYGGAAEKESWNAPVNAPEGAAVVLKGNGVEMTDVTDCFGDFKFDGLEAGTYTIEVNGTEMKKVDITESVNIGELFI